MGLRANVQNQPAQLAQGDDAVALFAPYGVMNWRTATGREIAHIVYSLMGCPPLQSATYLLVRRSADGKRNVLAVARTQRQAPTLNLARIREWGAKLGANEVHIHPICGPDRTRAAVERDLRLAHLRLGPADAADASRDDG